MILLIKITILRIIIEKVVAGIVSTNAVTPSLSVKLDIDKDFSVPHFIKKKNIDLDSTITKNNTTKIYKVYKKDFDYQLSPRTKYDLLTRKIHSCETNEVNKENIGFLKFKKN